MKLSPRLNKLLNNKAMLYVVYFITAVSMLGYLTTRKFNSLIFFALVAFLTSFFTKQRVIVLGTAIVATNLLVSRRVIEGMDHDGEEGEEEEEEEEAETEGMGGIEEISGGNGRIDLAATKKKNFKNLEKTLGTEGMAGLNRETKQLVKQQKQLTQALEGMAPIMNQASKLMDQFDGMAGKIPNVMGGGRAPGPVAKKDDKKSN
tara:strand:+ start:3717 stop:4328 length:612 start_codon:yes stop_codon:yes gene_type:complete